MYVCHIMHMTFWCRVIRLSTVTFAKLVLRHAKNVFSRQKIILICNFSKIQKKKGLMCIKTHRHAQADTQAHSHTHEGKRTLT